MEKKRKQQQQKIGKALLAIFINKLRFQTETMGSINVN
jgi:hypothetical protein